MIQLILTLLLVVITNTTSVTAQSADPKTLCAQERDSLSSVFSGNSHVYVGSEEFGVTHVLMIEQIVRDTFVVRYYVFDSLMCAYHRVETKGFFLQDLGSQLWDLPCGEAYFYFPVFILSDKYAGKVLIAERSNPATEWKPGPLEFTKYAIVTFDYLDPKEIKDNVTSIVLRHY